MSERALILRTCAADMTAHNGFIWPRSGPVEAPDWQATAERGNGLHGLLWGEGDGGLLSAAENAVWMVAEVMAAEVVDLGGKVKVPRADVIYARDGRAHRACLALAAVRKEDLMDQPQWDGCYDGWLMLGVLEDAGEDTSQWRRWCVERMRRDLRRLLEELKAPRSLDPCPSTPIRVAAQALIDAADFLSARVVELQALSADARRCAYAPTASASAQHLDRGARWRLAVEIRTLHPQCPGGAQ